MPRLLLALAAILVFVLAFISANYPDLHWWNATALTAAGLGLWCASTLTDPR